MKQKQRGSKGRGKGDKTPNERMGQELRMINGAWTSHLIYHQIQSSTRNSEVFTKY